MDFRIADTFTSSLAKLTGDEQKAVKQTAFDLQLDPKNPGLSFHKLDRAKDKNFWSVRAGSDIRVIVHRTGSSLMLCYVDHHDPAYAWAERRRIERHPKTGAAQIVQIRERVIEIEVPKFVEAAEEVALGEPAPAEPLFAALSKEDLLSYGVPAEWIDDVRQATADSLLELAEHLPSEAAEALLELATGGTPEMPVHAAATDDPFTHPDAQRRFRVMSNVEELEAALEYPWEKWTVFLHPAQRETVERSYNGPARVAGSAGTGKTVVALHRAVHLARQHPGAKVLLSTFSRTLAKALRVKLERLAGGDRELLNRINVRAIDEVGLELYEESIGEAQVAGSKRIRELLEEESAAVEAHRFSMRFLETEWADVVDAWQLSTWEEYRDVARLGRKTRLGEKQRALLWSIFEPVRAELNRSGQVTMPGVFARVTAWAQEQTNPAYDFAVIDEAQDVSVPQLRFLAALGGKREDALFFAGDLGQRIFQTPFSWKSLGVDVRGRSRTLRIDYRTSHQIRRRADMLLPTEMADVDGVSEERQGTVSAFNGPEPEVLRAESSEAEAEAIARWLRALLAAGVDAGEIGVFVRSAEQFERGRSALEAAGLTVAHLERGGDAGTGLASLCTMHSAKGLEFRAVVVAGCDDEVIPLQARIEAVADEADLEDVYNTERHLLYVACTRARDHLLVSGVEPVSEFLDDLAG